jgi:SAM-dependent methyltransferase
VDADELGIAPDGSPVLLYMTLPGHEEAALIHAAVPPGSPILELGCGTGRVTRHLLALEHRVTGVDNSAEMLAHLADVEGVEAILADIGTLDLTPRRWPVVVMASNLINGDRGPDFLAAAVHHVSDDGCVIVQRHEPGWVDTAEESTSEHHGITVAIRDIRHPRPGTLNATMIYGVQGHRFEQPFTAREVDDERLARLATSLGCMVNAVLDEDRRWVRLRLTRGSGSSSRHDASASARPQSAEGCHAPGVRGRALVDLNARHGEDRITEDRSGSKKPRQRTSLYGRRGDRRPM